MTRSPQMREAAAHSPKQTAALIDHPAHLSEHRQSAIAADPVEALQRQYAEFGLTLHQLMGVSFVATGPGLATRAMPDLRCARQYLRQLLGGAA
jgi:hypothetical protein